MNKQDTFHLVERYTNSQNTPPCDLGIKTLDFINDHKDAFWLRTNPVGHLTASGWVVNSDRSRVLLVHHRKLDMWLQPGGHIEDDVDLVSAARREVLEETGLTEVKLVSPDIYDIDIHRVPLYKDQPEHLHLDVRFLFEANESTPLIISDESHAVRWFSCHAVKEAVSNDSSMCRLLSKLAAA